MKTCQPLRIAVLSLSLIFIYFSCKAQEKDEMPIGYVPQTVFAELAGPGIFYSANYDTRFAKAANGFGGRLGIGFLSSGSATFFTVPLQLNYLVGKNGNYLEIGSGATLLTVNDSNKPGFFSFPGGLHQTEIIGASTIGYRYQPINGGISFRASFNPLFNSTDFVPYFGLSLGYAFK